MEMKLFVIQQLELKDILTMMFLDFKLLKYSMNFTNILRTTSIW